jgi:hypothetical protein
VFYDRYERPLVAYLGRRTRDPELTADLTAEVFASVLEHAAQFDPGLAAGENAASWLFAIARNTLLKSLRQGRVAADARRRLGMIEPLALEEDGYERIEAVATLNRTSVRSSLGCRTSSAPPCSRVSSRSATPVTSPSSWSAQNLWCASVSVMRSAPCGPHSRRRRCK